LLSVILNVIFFVTWLGSRSKREEAKQNQTDTLTALEEENTQLKRRIDEVLTSESEGAASSEAGEPQVVEPGEEAEINVAPTEASQKHVAFLQQFSTLQFGMGSENRTENLAQLKTVMSEEAYQEMNGSAEAVTSSIGYTVEVEETKVYQQISATTPNEYLLVVHQQTKTDQENATAVQSRLYYQVTLGNAEDGNLVVEEVNALMPYQ
jgi:hypothetical protein